MPIFLNLSKESNAINKQKYFNGHHSLLLYLMMQENNFIFKHITHNLNSLKIL